MSGNKQKMCRFGADCRFGTKCANEHTEDHKKIFAAKQAEKFKNMRACHNGSRCTKPGCTHGHDPDAIRAANERLGFIREIEIRVAEFYKIEAELAKIDKMIAEQEAEEAEEAKQAEEAYEFFFGNKPTELTEEERMMFYDFVEKNIEEEAEEKAVMEMIAEDKKVLDIVEEAFARAEACYGPPAGRSDNTPTCSGIPTKEELAPSVAALFTNAAAVPPNKTYAMAAMKVPSAPKKEPKPVKQPIWGFDAKGNCFMPPMSVDDEWGNAE